MSETTAFMTASPTRPPLPSWNTVRPLTRARQETGEVYSREPLVTTQITHLCALPDKERRAALVATYDSKDPKRIKEETLVYFAREYDRRGQKDAAWEVLEALEKRIPGHATRELAKWRLPAADVEECMEALTVALYERILSHEAENEFWEVRFWVCLDRRLHAFAEKRQRIRDSELRPADDFGEEEDGARGAEGIFAAIADPNASPEILLVRKDLQKRLSETEWQAVFLKYVEKIPEESGDESKVTIAKLLGVTGRSVRNYLRRAEKKLLDDDQTYAQA